MATTIPAPAQTVVGGYMRHEEEEAESVRATAATVGGIWVSATWISICHVSAPVLSCLLSPNNPNQLDHFFSPPTLLLGLPLFLQYPQGLRRLYEEEKNFESPILLPSPVNVKNYGTPLLSSLSSLNCA